MSARKPFCLVVAIIVCSIVVSPVNNAQGQEQKIAPELKVSGHKVILLNYTFGASPSTITAKKGTTIIWMNDGRSAATIKFTGKQVTLACKSPVHFVVDEQGSFTSNKIPPGAVASLCFVEAGTFDYTVTQQTPQTEPTKAQRESKGKIIIE